MSLNLVNPFMKFASGGAPSTSTALDDGILMGGSTSPWSVTDRVMHWDGTNWSNGTVLPAGRQFNAGGGDSSDAVWCGGSPNGGTSYVDDCEVYNGSTWSAVTNIDQNRYALQGGGQSDNFIYQGGVNQTGGKDNKSFSWNGSSWTTEATMSPASGNGYGYAGGDGTGSSCIVSIQSGNTANHYYKFSGGSWSNTATSNYFLSYSVNGGDADTALGAGGYGGGTTSNQSEYWDGSSWTSTNNLTGGSVTGQMGANLYP